MRVLILANNDGGLYLFRKELLKKIVSDNNELFVSFPDGEWRESIERLGCTYIKTDVDRRGMNPIKDFVLCLNYLSIIRKIKPDVVLLYTVKPNVYGGMACRVLRVPYISTVTGLGTSIENPGLLQKLVIVLYRAGLKKATAVMFQNVANEKIFSKLHIGNNHHIVPGSGVNLLEHCFEEYPLENSTVRFTFVGRIMKDKGISELLEAAKEIKKDYPAIQFDLIGGFDESYQAFVEQAVKDGYVNYLGIKQNIHPYYKDSWAIIMPSYHEGICNVCLEGASTGRPILASNVPGCIETFDEGITGFGFQSKDSKDLVRAIRQFISLPYKKKAAMGLAARQKMEKYFDKNIVIREYMNEILSIEKRGK